MACFVTGAESASVQRGLTQCAASVQIWGSSALERRHGAALEPLAQRSDALGGAHKSSSGYVPTNHIVSEPASQGESVHGGLTRTISGGGALERCQSRRRRQQLAQDDRSKLSDALAFEIELRDAVLTQRGERDPAEVGHGGVLEHCLCQSVGSLARDVVEAESERRHGAALEPLAERGDALGSERATGTAIIMVDTAELVVVQAARNKQ